MNSRLALVCTVGATLSFLIIALNTTSNQMVTFGQDKATAPKNETSSMTMMNANMSSGDKIPSLSTPGEKAFYVFTSEIEGVDEGKLKVAGDVFGKYACCKQGRQSYCSFLQCRSGQRGKTFIHSRRSICGKH